jgi:NAD(P)-dependent dehydrogenase (short-subunit alcohol dehydrogenase family)
MSADNLQQTYKSYLRAYSDVEPTEREHLLRESVTDDVISINPEGESRGIGELVKHIEQFQKQKPGAHFQSNQLLSHHDQLVDEIIKFVVAMQTIKRPSTPEDAANALSFLVSEDASFITGQILHVDGGFSRSGA